MIAYNDLKKKEEVENIWVLLSKSIILRFPWFGRLLEKVYNMRTHVRTFISGQCFPI